MTNEVAGAKERFNIPKEVGNNLVMVDRNLLESLIEEIEDKLDELEAITDPEFMKEVSMRLSDIESGKIAGLDEDKIIKLLKG
ncbi:hypothetical protein ANME2D_01422 [Candidatus Methanoperedens nitroreducens]|uniref:Uncharacterized protein n=1 Tax=Candidatus Methanoperedens nitratireducens TaxID=1392998 RepID=A0A062V3W5_9EURY|nr:hypothetical protein [Candidatus Methanoperedens nitroreducens]KCZ72022.1 hypothetical protein ANME2D_01422 [Candidatus Methanoperedens nitroreducens]MDJ1422003.1 hypothetical protein [Candidatus Methanoperedens sp.]